MLMCGIAGMISLPADANTVGKMLGTMKRRGPDGSGMYESEHCTLLHCRLAIVDPEGGKQPMELLWHGMHYVLVYNGELYNTEELRRELKKDGHVFQGYSDTEVILHS